MVVCEHCGEPMTAHEVPVHIFRIWRIEVFLWGTEEICMSCEWGHSRQPEDDAYNAGLEDGWTQAAEHHARWGSV